MRAVLLVAALALVLVSVAASAQTEGGWMSGNELKGFCYSEYAFDRGVCDGFATAVAGFTVRAPDDIYHACIPVTQVTRSQLRDIIVKYLDDHPAWLHFSATSLGSEALKEAFPCPK